VRKAPVAIAITMLAHTAALAWVEHRLRHRVELLAVAVPPAAQSETAPTSEPVIAVVLLDDHSEVAPHRTSGSSTTVGATAKPTAMRATASRAVSQSHEVAPREHGSSLMTMRGDGRGDGRAGHGTRSSGDPGAEYRKSGLIASLVNGAIDMPPGKPLEQPPPDTGELAPAGGGSYKSEHATFDARVAPDGTVKIHDRPDIGDVHVPRWNIGGVNVPLPLVVARLGFDDALMRAHGIDPYAAAKLRYLDKTRDERVAIGKHYRKEQLAHSPQLMRANLVWLWHKTTDPRERKLELFAMWDECAETGEPEVVDGATAARAYLIGFVRTKLPAGSADAFTADELAAFNAHRKSTATFAPYE
jgi:hypothetical protein